MRADDPFAALLAYEALAIVGKRVPTLSHLCRRHKWLIPLVLGAISLHIMKGEQ